MWHEWNCFINRGQEIMTFLEMLSFARGWLLSTSPMCSALEKVINRLIKDPMNKA